MQTVMRKFFLIALVLTLGVLPRAGTSEDIELFTSSPDITGQKPNILIIVDNSANWNTPFEMEKAALVSVVNGLDDRFNVGLMTVVQTSLDTTWPSRPNIEGSYVRFGVRNMNAANKTALSTLVGNWSNTTDNLTGDKGNNIFYGITMAEAYYYFAGLDSYSGYDQMRRDFAGNTVYNPLAASLPVNAWSARSAQTYTSPINAENNCAKNYIIFLSNGPANDKQTTTSQSVEARTRLAAAGGNTSVISLNPSGLEGSYADEWARFLYATDVAPGVSAKQNIITYTVDVPPAQGYDADHTALLKSMANQGHGRYFSASDASTLATVLKTIFNEIQAVDSVFAAVSLPVTVNVRGSYLNQVYMGVFRPDADASPRWPGNLKQYKVGYDAATNTGLLVDKNNLPLENTTTGFIVPQAVSFWTTPSTFWTFSPADDPLTTAIDYTLVSDSPDGAIVERGGAGQRLRATYATDQSTRNLYTTAGLADGDLLSAALFNISNTTGVTACDLKIVSPVSANLVRSATTVTASYTAPAGCNFSNGQFVRVSSAGDPAYDGYYTATGVTTSSLQFTVPTTPAYPEAGSYPDTSHLIYVSTAVPTVKTITSIYSDATTVYISAPAHGLTQATPITIAGSPQTKFNVSCTASVVNANNLTCLATATNKNKALVLGGTISFTASANRDVTNLTRTEPASGSNAVVTATTAVAHGISTGNSITVSGASGEEYNGTFSVTGVTATTLTYNINVGPATPSTASISAGSTTRDNLINWVRGQDNAVDENNNASYTDVRASIHGDVLHSRPAVVNYGRTTDDIVVYYGANDGIFHAVKGGRGDTDGYEKWGVVFPEFFGSLDRLRSQMPTYNYGATPVVPRPYFADGPVGVYVKDANTNNMLGDDGDIVNLYVGMRRGGRFMYALDANNPDAPKLLWKKSNTDTGFSELGQTWSEPRVGKLSSGTVIIFGAGYDPEHDDALPATTNDKGRGVFVLNATTGAKIKLFDQDAAGNLFCSVPADVMVLDRDSDGYSDRIYAGDTCGNLWRMDISDADSANWVAYKIAAIGGTGVDARKFLNAPSVVYGTDYDSILIGSGDREHPFDVNVQNRFYMFKDTHTGLTGSALGITAECTATSTNLYDVTPNSIQSADSATQTAAQSALTAAKGWCVKLDEGEKVVGNATTVLGVTYFGTNLPRSATDEELAACVSNLGEARLYAISFLDGSPIYTSGTSDETPRYEVRAGGGFPPSPVAVQVKTDDGHVVTGVISGTQLLQPPGQSRRTRVYWYREME